jgi:hypothetical protein
VTSCDKTRIDIIPRGGSAFRSMKRVEGRRTNATTNVDRIGVILGATLAVGWSSSQLSAQGRIRSQQVPAPWGMATCFTYASAISCVR